jgi:hypothetical protein
MGCSTMPVYSRLHSFGELKEELRKAAECMMQKFQMREYTDNPLLNVAMGYVAFARDERQLFRLLYVDFPRSVGSGGFPEMSGAYGPDSQASVEQQQAMEEIPVSVRDSLVRNTWIYTHGLAVMVNAGMLGACDDAMIRSYLEEAGQAFYLYGAAQTGGSDE